MANELETLPGGFSIVDTMEMGAGSQELLNDLFAPETVTTKTEEIQTITAPPKKEEPKTKKEEPKKEEPKKEEKKEKPLSELLTEDEEEEFDENGNPIEKKEPKEGEENNEPEDNKFKALSKDLFKLGVFSKGDGEEDVEINSPQELLDRFNLEKKNGAIEMVDRFIGQFGEDYQEAFDAIFVKGVDPKEYFGTFNTIQNFAELDLALESNQELVVRQGLLDQGFEPDKIAAKLEKIKSYGDLEDEAKSVHQILIKKETAKLAQMKQENETKLQQVADVQKQYIKNVQTILQDKLNAKEFDGIPINPKQATELQDFLLTAKYKTPSGETLTEFDKTILELKRPENHEKKVKLALILKVLEKDPTLSTIQKTGITKKTDALFGEVARLTTKSSVKSEKTQAPKQSNSWFSQ